MKDYQELHDRVEQVRDQVARIARHQMERKGVKVQHLRNALQRGKRPAGISTVKGVLENAKEYTFTSAVTVLLDLGVDIVFIVDGEPWTSLGSSPHQDPSAESDHDSA